ncbi:MAG: hypothetical protein RLZZ299_2677 [Pseudomonadota bacterium]
MIAALLALVAHAAEPAPVTADAPPVNAETQAGDAAQYARLFGGEGSAQAAPERTPAFPLWVVPAAVGALGLYAAGRLRAPGETGRGAPGVKLVSRQAVGDKSHLVVVDVPSADGNRRRLLVGTGGGAPSLVADLGPTPSNGSEADFFAGFAYEERKTTFQELLDSIGSRRETVTIPERGTRPGKIAPQDILDMPRGTSPGVPRATSPGVPRSGGARPRGVAAFAAHAEPSPRRDRDVAVVNARTLVDEVLAERGSDPGDEGRRRSRRTA